MNEDDERVKSEAKKRDLCEDVRCLMSDRKDGIKKDRLVKGRSLKALSRRDEITYDDGGRGEQERLNLGERLKARGHCFRRRHYRSQRCFLPLLPLHKAGRT